jgi:hypothetical protein
MADTGVEQVEALSDEDYLAAVVNAARDAENFIDEAIAPERELATAFYRGDPLGDEVDGQSDIVMTEVRDVVQAMLPSLLRIFCGSEKAVEFIPRGELKIEMAEQATDAINYCFYVENNGFRILFSAMKDALIRKTGILTWWVEEKDHHEEYEYDGMTVENLKMLKADKNCKILSSKIEATPDVDEEGKPLVPTYTVRVRNTKTEKVVRVECVPPEEYFIDREARDEDSAFVQGRRRILTVGQLVGMGYDIDDILANMGSNPGNIGADNLEAQTRNPWIDDGKGDTGDIASRRVFYREVYHRIDKEGSGLSEMRRTCLLGDSFVLHDEEWGAVAPFAILCPDPEPHTAIGASIADQVKDLQVIKSHVVRDTLDSLSNSIHPRTVIVEGQVNIDDALNTEVGAIIRARAPGMVQTLDTPFVGQYALPVIAYFDDLKARRTGVNDAASGLDAEALQSSTKGAVQAVVDGSQARVEMVARIFAETAIKRMFKELLRLHTQNVSPGKMIKLRGKFVPVNPKSWDANMDVAVNVGLGNGSPQERMAILGQVVGLQTQILGAAPSNPLVTLGELRNAVEDMLAISNNKNVGRYFKAIDPNAPPQQPEKPQDPAVLLAQVEMKKTEVQGAVEIAKDKRELLKMQLDADLERDKLANERFIKVSDMNLKYGAQIDQTQIQADLDRQRAEIDRVFAAFGQQSAQQHEAGQADADRQVQAQQAQLQAQQAAAAQAQQLAHDDKHKGHDRAFQLIQGEQQAAHGAASAHADRQFQGEQADFDRAHQTDQQKLALKAKPKPGAK